MGDSRTMLSSIFMSYYALKCAEPEQISTFHKTYLSDLMGSWNYKRKVFKHPDNPKLPSSCKALKLFFFFFKLLHFV